MFSTVSILFTYFVYFVEFCSQSTAKGGLGCVQATLHPGCSAYPSASWVQCWGMVVLDVGYWSSAMLSRLSSWCLKESVVTPDSSRLAFPTPLNSRTPYFVVLRATVYCNKHYYHQCGGIVIKVNHCEEGEVSVS